MTRVLPKGWEEKTLGEVCEINIGKTPSRADVSYWDKKKETNNIWLSIADLSNTTDKKVYSSKEFLSNKGAKIVPIVERGTLLLSFKLTIGRVVFAGVPLRTNEAIAQLPIKNANTLDKNYLYYYLQAYDYEELLQGDIKVKGKSLNKAKLKQLNVKFPSLPEQKRIVEKLDKIFANIDKAKEQTTQNLKNAKDVLESFLKKLFTENIKNWEETTFEKEIKIKSGDFLPSKSMNNGGKYEVYGGNGIAGYHDTMNYKGENVIIGRVGEKCGNVHYSNKEIWVTDNAFVVTNTKHNFDKKFLCTLLQTAKLRKYAAKSTHPVISGKSLRDVKLCFPASLQEQQRIIKQVAILQEQTQELETTYTKKLADLDELKQSVLQQAFSGKL